MKRIYLSFWLFSVARPVWTQRKCINCLIVKNLPLSNVIKNLGTLGTKIETRQIFTSNFCFGTNGWGFGENRNLMMSFFYQFFSVPSELIISILSWSFGRVACIFLKFLILEKEPLNGVYYLSYLIFLHFLFLLFVKVLIMVFFDFPHIGPPFLGGLSQPM